ncbi:MAG: histone deacetylase [Acidobacteria bacterium]|nr:histone deacetylase [Acidobacteriota bacterium]
MRAFTHESFAAHDTGPIHPESARRLLWAIEGCRRAGIEPEQPPPHDATEAVIRKVHSDEYIESFASAIAVAPAMFMTPDNVISPETWSAAWNAVGTALSAADAIMSDPRDGVFVIARPPGHHAERNAAFGFCYFNTIACAAEYLLDRHGLDRVFILDWDVHHGNGTQHIFERRSDVFYLSLHGWPFYPGTGRAEERGTGEGEGATRNFPLATGTSDRDYLRIFEREVVKEIEGYRPDAILISAGFDAHLRDPLGNLALTEEAFREMTLMTRELARRLCHGRILSLLEGGYDHEALAASVAAHLR